MQTLRIRATPTTSLNVSAVEGHDASVLSAPIEPGTGADDEFALPEPESKLAVDLAPGRSVRVVPWNETLDTVYRAPDRTVVLWFALEPGTGRVDDREGERAVTFPAAGLALIPADEPFAFRPEGPGAGAFIECDAGIDGVAARAMADGDVAPPYRFVRDVVALDAARLILTLSEASESDGADALLAELARLCVERVVAALAELEHRGARSVGGLDPERLLRVTRFVESGLERPLRLAEIADVAYLSASQFCRAFKASTGVSPLRYVRARRLARAETLLLESPSLSIAEVAQRCGFVAQSHLTRIMRTELGITPAALRRRGTAVNVPRDTVATPDA